ncbi:hypothetical protein LCGC14_0249690 [marine sediment metagenome]|uniref:Uncharacterized protein n=1 Tax=marine sediment metagenome TaxID=412755 RepID=A0A0F9WQD0_9ZZZZ
MATKELIDAIRTGTEETMALVFAGVADKKILRLLHCESPGRAAAVTAASAAMLEIADAIVAARPKPEDTYRAWVKWEDVPEFVTLSDDKGETADLCVVSGGLPNNLHRVTIIREPSCPQE